MKSQEHIRTLIKQLSESSKEDYTKVLRNFDFDTVDFGFIENWKENCYTRNCFYRDSNFELILICWDKSQATAIHDHDGEDCWVYLLKGLLEEDFYKIDKSDNLEQVHTRLLQPDDITKSDKYSGFHRLRNSTNQRSLSLHLYASPIKQSRTFDESINELVVKQLKDDSISSITTLQIS